MSVVKMKDFDISTISSDIQFVLDTNVLYFVHSGYYLPNSQECIDYSNIIQTILTSGHKIIISTLCIQELLYGIENKEYIEYCRANGLNHKSYTKKMFRANTAQRKAVEAKLKTVFLELSVYTIDNGEIRSSSIQNFINSFDQHTMDPIDYAMTDNYDHSKFIFVSNDKDFQSLPSLQVLTS